MKLEENRSGHSLLMKCGCGWVSLLHCATRTVVEQEEHKVLYCPKCGSDFLIFFRTRGKHSFEEMKRCLNV